MGTSRAWMYCIGFIGEWWLSTTQLSTSSSSTQSMGAVPFSAVQLKAADLDPAFCPCLQTLSEYFPVNELLDKLPLWVTEASESWILRISSCSG